MYPCFSALISHFHSFFLACMLLFVQVSHLENAFSALDIAIKQVSPEFGLDWLHQLHWYTVKLQDSLFALGELGVKVPLQEWQPPYQLLAPPCEGHVVFISPELKWIHLQPMGNPVAFWLMPISQIWHGKTWEVTILQGEILGNIFLQHWSDKWWKHTDTKDQWILKNTYDHAMKITYICSQNGLKSKIHCHKNKTSAPSNGLTKEILHVMEAACW